MESPAIGYLGVEFTYRELRNKVDCVANSLSSLGISDGCIVLVGVSNSPEAVISLLALSKIGAVSKWFDIRAGEG